ncbi:hypothetical protein C7S20_17370 [Christiangramia fulva]|uniref:Glycosyl transferase family 1 domain-containing protein n=1 Tax=Christiangramia fulva TaxID=2126553 RepID=A0A2R3Z9H0_9FLAO|nr:glycosyltransferase family 4 protein [Christiangramia fulva]AVR46887.1 hypothetical protein C7S20_17370 [Christiangramia fulva]
MKILYYTTSYHASHGGSIQSIEFFRHLDKDKSVEKYLFPETGKDSIKKPRKDNGIKSFLKKFGLFQAVSFFRRNRFYFSGLIKRIREVKPDVLILQMDSNFLQIDKLRKLFPDLLICAQINGSPFDEFYRNITFRNLFIKKQRHSYTKSDLNFFISDFSRQRIMGSDLDESRDKVIYNGTDISKFFPLPDKKEIREKLGYPEDKIIIGYIGTLDFHKKLLRLTEAFREIEKELPDTALVIIGDGPAYSKIHHFIKHYSLENKIILKGWIKHEQVNEHLNCFDIAVHHYANHYMNPLKIFEYLAAGLPVIAPDIDSVKKIFRNNEDLIISSEDNRFLKEDLLRLIENKDFREGLRNNHQTIERIAKKYTWDCYSQTIIQEINQKLNKSLEED